jgi:hypothetical protein
MLPLPGLLGPRMSGAASAPGFRFGQSDRRVTPRQTILRRWLGPPADCDRQAGRLAAELGSKI